MLEAFAATFAVWATLCLALVIVSYVAVCSVGAFFAMLGAIDGVVSRYCKGR
jgi:hypothetical protein